jgi:Lon protease-like protein
MASIQIPKQVGVILLPNAVTFPHGILPLHIFEPRYRKMLADASESDSMICVANLQSEETADPSACTSKVGFIGLIRVSEKQDDGRSNLILHSISRVEFLSWESDPACIYPRANIKPITNIIEPITDSTELVAESLRDAASRFLTQFTDEVIAQTNETLDRVNEDLAMLTDVVAQQFVIDEHVRQSLLEENNPTKRAETLIRHLRIQKIPT